MDPKGDRLRKIQMGQLILPEAILKINTIQLAEQPVHGGGGCLEGGPRPRARKLIDDHNISIPTPVVISANKKTMKIVNPDEIPLPSNADIPLPSAGDIPLPNPESIPLPCGDVPKPCPEDIPLPSNDSIPLPSGKPNTHSNERRKIRVLQPLEPCGDELLCRSCVMRFSKQQDYDTHLQSDEHQQAIEDVDLFGSKSPGANLLTQRLDKKSPGHDAKSAHVSFGFKKNLGGSRITNTQPFARREEHKSPIEIKLLKPETENGSQAVEEAIESEKNNIKDDSSDSLSEWKKTETEGDREDGGKVNEKKLMCSFVKVQSKDESGRLMDWPKEMIQYTEAQPKIMFSCNPLVFDFSILFSSKSKKSEIISTTASDTNVGFEKEIVKAENIDSSSVKIDGNLKNNINEKKKSHKKKKKHGKKHKNKNENKEIDEKSKEKGENKEGAVEKRDTKAGEEEKMPDKSINSKKKRRKHKKRSEEENNENKENLEKNDEKKDINETDTEKKKHKKSKKKSKHSEDIAGKVDGKDENKHKSKKKKKSKKREKKIENGNEVDKLEGAVKETTIESETAHESDGEKGKDGKTKHKKRKHKKKDVSTENNRDGTENNKIGTENNEDGQNEEMVVDVKVGSSDNANVQQLPKRKFSGAESDSESEKIVAKLQALSRIKTVQMPVTNNVVQKKLKKDISETAEKKTPLDRKRLTSESSVNESSTPLKKLKVTPKATSVIDHVIVATQASVGTVKVEKEDSWSKIETQTIDNVKSKWDTSDSDIENPLDKTVKREKMLKKRVPTKGLLNKASILKALKSPPGQNSHKAEIDAKKVGNPSLSNRSSRSIKSNVSAGSNQPKTVSNDKTITKSKKTTKSPASSHSRSRSRSHSYHRSYSRTGSSSRSRSYSSSSYYSDDSRHSKKRHHRGRRSSSHSYSRSSSRTYSYRSHSSSCSKYSRARSYSSSRSRSRSHRRHKRSYSRSRSRSYSTASYSSRSRSRNRYRKKGKRKGHRKSRSRPQLQSPAPIDAVTVVKKKNVEEKTKVKEEKVDPSEIPLPNLSNEKDDERTEEKLLKLKEKKRKTDVGETVAKLVESRPSDIPLPFSEGSSQMVSSDALPTGPPTEAPKETDNGFIGPKMPAPPPPPPQFNNPRFAPNHGPIGPSMPGYGPGMWDHWDSHGPWDGPCPWDGPGHRPPFRAMRPPPYDPRMYGPYDPRRRGPPPPYMNRPRGPPFLGPRYPGPAGPHGPPPDYPPEYDAQYTEDEKPKRESPPPLPKEPPREPSPKPPPPKKKEHKEPEQNPDIVIPPEQVEQYKNLQKQAAKHARRQLRRQAKRDLGEPDSTSSESEPEEQPVEVQEEPEDSTMYEEAPQLIALPQTMILAQPQPAVSPTGGYIVVVSGGQQYLAQKSHYVQAGMTIPTVQPMIISQGSIMASAAAAATGAHPAHIMQPLQQVVAAPAHMTGMPMTFSSLHQLQQIQQLQQLQQLQQIQQIQNAHAIQAHNQAVAMAAAQHGPIIVGNRILVPTLGVRPGF